MLTSILDGEVLILKGADYKRKRIRNQYLLHMYKTNAEQLVPAIPLENWESHLINKEYLFLSVNTYAASCTYKY